MNHAYGCPCESCCKTNPSATEHTARQVDPDEFTSFRRENAAFTSDGRQIDVVWGIVRGSPAEVQSIRFPASRWTAVQARAWLRQHGYDESGFVAASKRRIETAMTHRKQIEAAVEEYEAAHWGAPASVIYDVDHDPHLPPVVVQMGYLRQIQIQAGDQHYCIDFANPSSIAYAQDKVGRLYLVLSKKDKADVLKLVESGRVPCSEAARLGEVARAVGGRHGKVKYPNVTVGVLGVLTHVIYRTTKTGDGKSDYIHEMGEERGGVQPAVCIDKYGHLLLAGGSYVVEHRGIVN